MIIPIRCFTCNKLIAHLWAPFEEYIKSMTHDEAFDKINFPRNDYCCRRMFLGHVNVIDTLLKYSNNPGEHMTTEMAESVSDADIDLYRQYYSSTVESNLQNAINIDALDQDEPPNTSAMDEMEYHDENESIDADNSSDDEEDEEDDLDPDEILDDNEQAVEQDADDADDDDDY